MPFGMAEAAVEVRASAANATIQIFSLMGISSSETAERVAPSVVQRRAPI
jgi:hypothetical protein